MVVVVVHHVREEAVEEVKPPPCGLVLLLQSKMPLPDVGGGVACSFEEGGDGGFLFESSAGRWRDEFEMVHPCGVHGGAMCALIKVGEKEFYIRARRC